MSVDTRVAREKFSTVAREPLASYVPSILNNPRRPFKFTRFLTPMRNPWCNLDRVHLQNVKILVRSLLAR